MPSLRIFEACVYIPREHTHVNWKTILLNKNSELVTEVHGSFTKVNRFPIYVQ